LNFELIESKLVPPIFIPASNETSFDATYDLEELLLKEVTLEVRIRKQKPRAELRQYTTTKEIRENELYRIIEIMFEPFNYTMASYAVTAAVAPAKDSTIEALNTGFTRSQPSLKAHSQATTPEGTPPISPSQSPSYRSSSNLADRATTLPVDAAAGREAKESGSVLGFLRGKKTRYRTPKPKEAGVLGKAGARHIIS